MDGANIVVLACFWVMGLAVGALVGAIILRTAIRFYNRLAGGPGAPAIVPMPTVAKAMVITAVAAVVQAILGLVIGAFFTTSPAGAGWGVVPGLDLTSMLVAAPVTFVVQVKILATMLPTTFRRAALVIFCQFLVILLVAGIVAASLTGPT